MEMAKLRGNNAHTHDGNVFRATFEMRFTSGFKLKLQSVMRLAFRCAAFDLRCQRSENYHTLSTLNGYCSRSWRPSTIELQFSAYSVYLRQ